VLEDHVVFVAVKNGMHDAEGYLFTTLHELKKDLPDNTHVKQIGSAICHYFQDMINDSDVRPIK
jgi:hypothetical protein